MKTYTCYCNLQLIAKDGECLFKKIIEIPFVPNPNIGFTFYDGVNEITYKPEFIEWVVDEDGYFNLESTIKLSDCVCTPDEECCVISSWIEELKKLGWEQEGDIKRGWDRVCDEPWIWNPEQTFSKRFQRGKS